MECTRSSESGMNIFELLETEKQLQKLTVIHSESVSHPKAMFKWKLRGSKHSEEEGNIRETQRKKRNIVIRNNNWFPDLDS